MIETFERPAAIYSVIPLSQIQESTTNPRKRFDDAALTELSISIRAKGILQPVLVRPLGEDLYELVAGARRLRASILAELDEIPATIRHLTDEETIEAQVIENAQREDVHPLEEAFGYEALLRTEHYSSMTAADAKELIAGKVGKSVSFVYQRLKLLDLNKKAQQLFLEGELSAGHAVLIARLSPKEQEESLKVCFTQNDYQADTQTPTGKNMISVRKLAQWIKQSLYLDLDKAPFDRLSETLLPQAGSCQNCLKRTGHQSGLFEGFGTQDLCSDRSCFEAKIEAHLLAQKAEIEESGDEVALLSQDFNGKSKVAGAIPCSNWHHAHTEEDKKIAKKGLVVDGYGRGQVIEYVEESERAALRSAEDQKRKEAEAEKKRDFKARPLVFAELLPNLEADPYTASDMALICVQLFHRSDIKEKIAKRRGWVLEGSYYSDEWRQGANSIINSMSFAELRGLLFELAIGKSVYPDQYATLDTWEPLSTLAKSHNMNAEGVRAAIFGQWDEKASKGKAKAESKAAKEAEKQAKSTEKNIDDVPAEPAKTAKGRKPKASATETPKTKKTGKAKTKSEGAKA